MRERESVLVYFPNTCSGQGWVKVRARNWEFNTDLPCAWQTQSFEHQLKLHTWICWSKLVNREWIWIVIQYILARFFPNIHHFACIILFKIKFLCWSGPHSGLPDLYIRWPAWSITWRKVSPPQWGLFHWNLTSSNTCSILHPNGNLLLANLKILLRS